MKKIIDELWAGMALTGSERSLVGESMEGSSRSVVVRRGRLAELTGWG